MRVVELLNPNAVTVAEDVSGALDNAIAEIAYIAMATVAVNAMPAALIKK